jgi:hypothetical protein
MVPVPGAAVMATATLRRVDCGQNSQNVVLAVLVTGQQDESFCRVWGICRSSAGGTGPDARCSEAAREQDHDRR